MRFRIPLAPTVLRLALAGVVGLSACAGDDRRADSALDYSENAPRAYAQAKKGLADKNWEAIDQLFNDVRRKYGYSR